MIRAKGVLAKQSNEADLPVTGGSLELDALRLLESLLGLFEAGLLCEFLTDLNLLTLLLGSTDALFFVDADLFLNLSVAARGRVDGGG